MLEEAAEEGEGIEQADLLASGDPELILDARESVADNRSKVTLKLTLKLTRKGVTGLLEA